MIPSESVSALVIARPSTEGNALQKVNRSAYNWLTKKIKVPLVGEHVVRWAAPFWVPMMLVGFTALSPLFLFMYLKEKYSAIDNALMFVEMKLNSVGKWITEFFLGPE